MSEVNKDLALISKIIEQKDFLTPKRMGVRVEMLEGPGRKLWEFIEDYYTKYRSVPTLDTMNSLLADAKTKLWVVIEPIQFLSEEIIRRDTFEHLKKLQFEYDQWMNSEKPEEVVSNIQNAIRKLSDRSSSDLEVVLAADVLPDVLQAYADAQNGIQGIRTICEQMDEATGGWCKGDLSFFVARSGIGKSFSLILAAQKALMQGKKVLFFNGEMSNKDIIYRHIAIDYKIPYSAFRRGKLSEADMETLKKAIQEYQSHKTLKVVDASGGVNTSQIEAIIDQHNPDLVCIDATYRIRSSAKTRDRFENTANVVTELKSICGRQKVPIIGSTQLNRDAGKKKDGEFGTEDLAMSDVLAWESTNIFALYQGDEEKAKKQMLFKAIKVREMEKANKPMKISWDFDKMTFHSIGQFDEFVPPNPIDHF